MMRTYLQDLYDAIPFSIDAIRNRADWLRWRPPTLAALRMCLGLQTFPPRTPLRPRVMGVLHRDGYALERMVFETRPGFLMTAHLYRPEGLKGRAPGILCVHGHSDLGKTVDEVQLRSIAFARAGWVVLAVDATGHGERVHIGHRRKFAIITAGLALEGIQVWDNMRAVDYLISRPEVDARRLGITGCSGGGNQTMYTAAMDDRLGVAVPVCSVSTLRGQIFTPNSIGCDCECVPDVMRHGLENAVMCGLIAPRRLLVLSGTNDVTFPIQYTRVANAKLRRFFRAIGCGESYRFIEKPVTHGYHKPLREQAGAWFARWFCPEGPRPRYSEAGAADEPPERIWCFPGGKLPAESATLGTVAHAAAVKLAKRLRVPKTAARREALRAAIRDEVLGGFPLRGPLGAKETKALRRDGAVRWSVTLRSEPGITIQASIARPADGPQRCPCVVLVRPEPGQPDRALAGEFLSRGVAVAELDVRPLAGDEHAGKAALVLGRPMVGMGAYDITRFVDYLAGRGDIDPAGVSLWAEGLMTLPALYAIALDERIAGGTLAGLLSTYISPVPVPHPTWTFARGLLKFADIDHLLALSAPRPVTVLNPVGPDTQPLSPAACRKAFPAAGEAYGRTRQLQVFRSRRR
jgi:acetyl esterase/lipase